MDSRYDSRNFHHRRKLRPPAFAMTRSPAAPHEQRSVQPPRLPESTIRRATLLRFSGKPAARAAHTECDDGVTSLQEQPRENPAQRQFANRRPYLTQGGQRVNKIAFLLSLALVVPISADQQEKLTGDDVVKLLEAKIRQSLIVEIVKSTPGSYDLNAEAVKALRQHGATQPVLDAMRAHAPTPAAPASTSPLLAAIPSRFPREDVLRTRAAGMQGEQCQQ